MVLTAVQSLGPSLIYNLRCLVAAELCLSYFCDGGLHSLGVYQDGCTTHSGRDFCLDLLLLGSTTLELRKHLKKIHTQPQSILLFLTSWHMGMNSAREIKRGEL